MLNLSGVTVLSFDCYGTLIDWESGILSALRPLLSRHQVQLTDSDLLQLYGRFEREAQAHIPFINYRTVLGNVTKSLGNHLDLIIGPGEETVLAESMAGWRPFPDTVAALRALKKRCRLGILSNVDDDLFHSTQALLGVPFDWVITSEQLGSYKPSKQNFHYAVDAFGVEPGQHVHVAQSVYHDIAPAHSLGIKTVWVNRQGAAATPVIDAVPDLEVPDLRSLASLMPPAPGEDR